MNIKQVISNRLKLEYNEDADGESFLISTIADSGETQLCRVTLDNISELKNFTDLALQFMGKCKQEREQNSQIAPVRGGVERKVVQ